MQSLTVQFNTLTTMNFQCNLIFFIIFEVNTKIAMVFGGTVLKAFSTDLKNTFKYHHHLKIKTGPNLAFYFLKDNNTLKRHTHDVIDILKRHTHTVINTLKTHTHTYC